MLAEVAAGQPVPSVTSDRGMLSSQPIDDGAATVAQREFRC
jgi:hypothetical protein